MDRVSQIVARRLTKYGISVSPQVFFPPYEKQEAEIETIKGELRANWKEFGRGNRANDDATRYARPEYIRRLQDSSKSGSTYQYAGFEQLVHLSSGVIRYFLESAL